MLSTAKCGTRSGYNKHLRLKEKPCNDCKTAQSAYSNQYQKDNPDKKRKYVKKYLEKNYEKKRQYSKKFYIENRERILKYSKEYYEQNKQRSFAKTRRRKQKLATLRYEVYSVEQILELYGTACHICGKEIDLTAPRSMGKPGWQMGLHLDHVIPIYRGGTDTVDNVKPAHAICNVSKGTAILEDKVC